ncbi:MULTISPECIES: hypothetical protein [unclassified Rhodococcus (in: high G+C Gram-positive bacteria)]|uniref:hypothetical protein n=1 Tax=unclassified Rhodococcus (in: high G+C Gram-positive bacteria) TaxID=192944 RepID=UPI000B9C2F8C|nr:MULTISPECIES: hypothetical protein [unclassified Rhodococcus (in: high G+C Gram-positive bacteria)]OZE41420.1 hypothetical protein CH259_03050 [Rhodococcus sp. 05-2254-4]OZE51808.1 hypothetical protein CH261_00140 [Rhodococcus sp. 05-2254-3]OZE55941.1 hypothetical protein CH283_00135 [Rhodococcus sp. 05-2254-2]
MNGPEPSDEEFDHLDETELSDDSAEVAKPAAPQLDPGVSRTSAKSAVAAWFDFTTANRSQLQNGSPANSQDPSALEAHLSAMRKTQQKKEEQANDQREKFFKWSVWAVSGTLVGNFGIFVLYLKSQWGEISDLVMTAWISATVVEVLGIAYIIASHLFPNGTRNAQRRPSRDEPGQDS